jgi:hypothetical protein
MFDIGSARRAMVKRAIAPFDARREINHPVLPIRKPVTGTGIRFGGLPDLSGDQPIRRDENDYRATCNGTTTSAAALGDVQNRAHALASCRRFSNKSPRR